MPKKKIEIKIVRMKSFLIMETNLWFNSEENEPQCNGIFCGIFNKDPFDIGSELLRPVSPDPQFYTPTIVESKLNQNSKINSPSYIEQYCSEPLIPSFGSDFQSSNVPTLSLFDFH